VAAGFRFSRFRPGLEDIIYKNRFDKGVASKRQSVDDHDPLAQEIGGQEIVELDGMSSPAELSGEKGRGRGVGVFAPIAELPAEVPAGVTLPIHSKESKFGSSTSNTTTTIDDLLSRDEQTSMTPTLSEHDNTGETAGILDNHMTVERTKSENILSRGMKAMGTRKLSSKFGLTKSKTKS